jgi:DNA helicase-2/ATP-dependent DNA helicase PcrA
MGLASVSPSTFNHQMQPNQQQLNFINASDDRIVLSAVPGSGKTHSIALKIAHEIKVLGLNPDRIVCLSFTVAGAEAIKQRLGSILGWTARPIGFCGTIDAYCKLTLETFGAKLGYRGDVSVNEDLAFDIVLEKLKLADLKKKDAHKVFGILGAEPTLLISPHHIVAKAVLMEMRRLSIGTFQSIKLEAIRVMNDIGKFPVESLHLDEAQDMNSEDWIVANSINAPRMTVVGDEDQTLYEFRGSEPGEFVSRYHSKLISTPMTLTTNYRSDRLIVGSANQLIAHNRQRVAKAGVADSLQDGILRVLPPATPYHLANVIQATQSPNASLAALFRYNKEVDLLREELKRHSNPVKTNVHIGTIHSAKGLEFDRVILNDWEPANVDEEERRLFYVGMTRAKSQLDIVTERQSPFTREAGL